LPSPPSEPYGRFSRIRLSSQWFPHRTRFSSVLRQTCSLMAKPRPIGRAEVTGKATFGRGATRLARPVKNTAFMLVSGTPFGRSTPEMCAYDSRRRGVLGNEVPRDGSWFLEVDIMLILLASRWTDGHDLSSGNPCGATYVESG
jgi:hypothetical protein